MEDKMILLKFLDFALVFGIVFFTMLALHK